MPKILVTFALRQEGASFERRLTQRTAKSGLVRGHLESQEIAVYWLGTGVRDEDQFKSTLTDLRSDLVINSGFAGAVRSLLEPGDFVLAENFSSPELLKRLEKDRVFETRGRFVCVDAVCRLRGENADQLRGKHHCTRYGVCSSRCGLPETFRAV